MSRFCGEYPEDWPTIAQAVKERTGGKCERCGHIDDRESGHVLTVHHLDNNKANVEGWNLAALCQKCHLHIQGRVIMAQIWMLDHSDWMKPHVDGYLRAVEQPEKPEACP